MPTQVPIVEITPINNAQFKALPTTPVQVVPTPGPGKMVQLIACTFYANLTTGYTDPVSSDALFHISYTDQSGDIATPTSGINVQGSTHIYSAGQKVFNALGISTDAHPRSGVVDAPLVLWLDLQVQADLAGGNVANTMVVTVTYLIVDL